MKRKLYIAYMLTLSLSLAACGSKDKKNSKDEVTESNEAYISEANESVAPESEVEVPESEADPAPVVTIQKDLEKENTVIVSGEAFTFSSENGIENYKDIPGAAYVTNEAIASRNVASIDLVSGEGEIGGQDASVIFNFPCESDTGYSTYKLNNDVYAAYKSIAFQKDYEIDGLTMTSETKDAVAAGYIPKKEGQLFTFTTIGEGNTDFAKLKEELYSVKSLKELWSLEYGEEARLIICSNEMIEKYDYLSIPEIVQELNSYGLPGEEHLLYCLALAKNLHALKEGEIDSFAYKKIFITPSGTNFIYVTIYGAPDTVENWFEGLYY